LVPLADYLPYVVTRTWHTQLGISGCDGVVGRGPVHRAVICGYEPKHVRSGVVFFGAAIVTWGHGGQWLSVMHLLPGSLWFWFNTRVMNTWT
jgi:nitric oxide reductase subunit B